MTMRALVLDAPGDPQSLHIAQIPVPEPGPGQVLVRVHACGLNPVDVKTARSGDDAWHWPHVLGLDVAGTVEAVGEGAEQAATVPELGVGSRVVLHHDLRRGGGYADYVVVDACALARIPQGVSAQDAAALPCAAMTAYQALTRLALTSGSSFLVTGGAGGVGGYAVQLARHLGTRVIATASAANLNYVRSLGADEVIDYQAQDVVAQVRERTDGRGVDAVLDTVGSRSATDNLRALAFNGALAYTAGRPDLDVLPPFGVSPSLHEISLGAAYSHGDEVAVRDLSVMLAELLSLLLEGGIDPCVQEVVDLEDVPRGLERLATGHGRGKIVAAVSPEPQEDLVASDDAGDRIREEVAQVISAGIEDEDAEPATDPAAADPDGEPQDEDA